MQAAAQLVIPISDPRGAGAAPGALARFGARFILDPRDLPFLWLMVSATAVLVPLAAWLFVPGRFSWWLAAAYLGVLFFVFLDRFILMLHNTSHRPLFKARFRVMNQYIPWVLGPLFGETPETYLAHHLGMHHPENNLEDDLSSTMRYQRDRFDHFLHYFFRFFFLGLAELGSYLFARNRKRLCRKMVTGEVTYLVAVAALLALNWRAALTVFVIPFVAVRFLMMAGNWGQHAFIDGARPENCYVNSITCINSRYNRRCFNDGYHIGHHLKPNRHWTEMPGDFERNLPSYAREGAFVFQGIDFFGVWLFLMLRRYGALAKCWVEVSGKPRPADEIIALLRERTRPILR